ncbi:MAG: CPXCG motif-containing cysteine-rich protein [Candidatus Omnitrophica bacterium]|nr:CPXCG motif-containing cysteine-rich protein [Candidatus Omnitrophota bacterium]
MNLSSEQEFFCPYCGSPNSISLDNEGHQFKLVVDCEVCCRPILIQVRIIGDDYELDVHTENE